VENCKRYGYSEEIIKYLQIQTTFNPMKKLIITFLFSAISFLTIHAQILDLKNLEIADKQFDEAIAAMNLEATFLNVSPDCVFYGTDPTEKWNIAKVKAQIQYGLKNKIPPMQVISKDIIPTADGNSAVIIKKVNWAIFKGELREICFYEKQRDGWKMKVWTLNINIPNAKNEAVNKLMNDK
jgi:SnoaL-like domain